MKATELMIGDLVKKDYNIVKILEIITFGRDDGDCEINGEWRLGEDCGNIFEEGILLNDLEPIPLTPEILEKNGFYKDWDNKTYLMGELFRLTPLTDGMGYYLNKWVSMQIYSVHQLQHALRLCGLNELADNFKVE